MSRTRKSALEEILDKVKETPGFKVKRERGHKSTYRVVGPGTGSWLVTIGTASAKNERAWRSALSRLGWSHSLWEQAQEPDDEPDDASISVEPAATTGVRGDEPVDERGFPLVTTSLEEQYANAQALIDACEMRWQLMIIGREEAEYLLSCHAEAAEARGKAAGLTDDPLPLDAPDTVVQQRKMNETNVDKIERLMRNGDWVISPQGLAIGVDGWLGDGQHRVEAIQRSGTVQVFWVCDNVPDSVFPYLDRGKPRSDVDLMHMRGKSTDMALPSTLKLLWLYDNVPYIDEWNNRGRTPVGDELFQYGAKHYQDVEGSLKATNSFTANKPALTKTAAAALRYVVVRDNPNAAERVDDFLKQVRNPPKDASDSAYILHQHGKSRFFGDSPIREKMEVSHWLFLAGLWAWRRHVEGASLKRLGWRPDRGIPRLPKLDS